MKLRLIVWMVSGLLLLCSRVGAAEAVAPDQPIKAFVREWVDAKTRQDETTLRRILDDRIVATFGNAAPFGKEAHVKAIMETGKRKMLGHDVRDQTIVVDGDTAVEAGVDAIRFATEGAESVSTCRYTATYIKRNDH